MTCKRLFVYLVATGVFAGAILWTGSGTAAAVPWEKVMAAIKQVLPVAVKKTGFPEITVERLLVSSAKLRPIADEAELARYQTEWAGFQPRTPARGEVVGKPPTLPKVYKHAAEVVCSTAIELADPFDDSNDNKSVWRTTVDKVNEHIAEQSPVGKGLAIYKSLNDINTELQNGCICTAVAKLGLFWASQKYC